MEIEPSTVVLVTDCEKGVGFATAILLAKDGRFKVYATVRNMEGKDFDETTRNGTITTLVWRELNPCSDEDVSKLLREILAIEGHVDVLVSNTGSCHTGPVESVPFDKITDIFDNNVYSVVRLIRGVLPSMKLRNSGRLLIVSSVNGILGAPFNSVYCASKFAIEGLAESLAAEVYSYNIRVSVVEPGPILGSRAEHKTEPSCNSKDLNNSIDDLTKGMFRISEEKQLGTFKTMGQRPEDIASEIVAAISSPNPHFRYITNRLYASAISEKLKDITGDSVVRSLTDTFAF